ncbi:MAG: hypothetical protein IK014_05500 [Lachnospiraceae bacterium]|nr:hypothetical protein [Lachnospiraceae bacterium]
MGITLLDFIYELICAPLLHASDNTTLSKPVRVLCGTSLALITILLLAPLLILSIFLLVHYFTDNGDYTHLLVASICLVSFVGCTIYFVYRIKNRT